MRAPFWNVLDIPPTSSEADIRRAYAVKVRVTNPEDDPDGFKMLRQAYEHALSYARYLQQYPPGEAEAGRGHPAEDDQSEEVHDDEDGDAFSVVPRVSPPLSVSGFAEAPPAPATRGPLDIERRDHEGLCRQLVNALRDDASPNVRVEAFNAVVKSPAMQQIDVFTATESWIAHTLVRSRPTSDPLFEPAIAFFKWEDERVGDRNDGAQQVLHIRRRLRDEQDAHRLLQRLKDRRHEHHKAWQETMRPPSQRSWLNKLTSFGHTARVMSFLHYIRGRNQLVWDSLNHEAVDWWQQRSPIGLRLFAGLRLAFLVAVVGAIGGPLLAILDGPDMRSANLMDAIAAHPPPPLLASADDLGPTLLDLVPASASDAQRRYAARRDCREAVQRLAKVPRVVKTFATSRADVSCRKILEMTPNSLLMRQYAGIVALRLGEADTALNHFETILKASPDDAFALFGKGLVSTITAEGAGAGDPSDMSDALAMNADVAPYFDSFGLSAPGAAPSRRKPRSRLPERQPIRADTDAEEVEGPRNGQDLADYFGIDGSTAGEVVVDCIITAEGRAFDCYIASEDPNNVGLGEVGLLAMEDVRYRPPKLEGEPVGGLRLRYTLRYNTPN